MHRHEDIELRRAELTRLEDEVNGLTRNKTESGIEYITDSNGNITFTNPISRFELISLVRNITSPDFEGPLYIQDKGHNEKLKSFLQLSLAPYSTEVFAAIWLDSDNKVIKFEKLFYGSETNVYIPCKEFVRAALNIKAAAAIITHNHPAPYAALPSDEDKKVTRRLQQALVFIGLYVMDHIIVSRHSTYSFRENDMMNLTN